MTDRPPLEPAALTAALHAPDGPLGPEDRLDVVARTGSTSTDLTTLLSTPEGARGLTATGVRVLVADHQQAGRGRAGRQWETPAGVALTFSLAVRPAGGPDALGWAPLVAGLAVARALRSLTGLPVGLKWPNDLLVDAAGPDEPGWGTARKVGGILAELVTTPQGPVVVLGIGLNVLQRADELPVPSATSLAHALAGGPADVAGPGRALPAPSRADVLEAVLRSFRECDARWRAARGDVVAAGLDVDVARVCLTLGREVRVELPGGHDVVGRAVRLAHSGGLVLATTSGTERTVLAGDVRHLRTT